VQFASHVALDGVAQRPDGRIVLLARDANGRWLVLWDDGKRRSLHRDSKVARFGPAGLALDRRGRPVVGYALWLPSHKSYLRLAQVTATGDLRVRAVTREGFPSSSTLPAAAPVVLPSGAIRVVETFLPAAIDWGLTGWGKLLFSTALGIPTGRVVAAAAGSTLYAAWTVAYPTLGPPGVALASHGSRVRSGLVLENAVLGGFALTSQGPEVAASRCIPAAAFGLDEGNGVCGGVVAGLGVDGVVGDYGFVAGERRLLLQTDEGLDWYASPAPLDVRVTLNADLTGTVEGAFGGVVTVYRELPGTARSVFATVPLGAGGTFSVTPPPAPDGAAYRAVYEGPETQIPYAALVKP
jgi:hypothetical protein